VNSAGQPIRLPAGAGIDRARPLAFTFDGKRYGGFHGDTVASALLANGVHLVGRSFKYHRPRGILSAGSEEPNALIELRTRARREPNTRATVAELYDGLIARSQNRWPSLRRDMLAINSLAAPVLKAGFYYKTFMWPQSFWEKVYEPLIRRAAGLGRAPGAGDPDHYEKAFAFCDVLVIGGGPAGLAAALAAGRSGARVILCEEDFALGGRLQSDRRDISGASGAEWVKTAEQELRSFPETRIYLRTTVFGAYDHGVFGAVERVCDHLFEPLPFLPRQRFWHITAKRVVLAAGAIERPLVFAGNDRPGVMLAGAVRTYINRFGALPGRRAIIVSASDDAWITARDLTLAGATVAAIVDARPDVSRSLRAMTAGLDIEAIPGACITGTIGSHRVRTAEIIDTKGRRRRIACDLIAMSNGWNPSVDLTCHLGGKQVWDEGRSMFLAGNLPAGMTVAGAAAGELNLAACLATGARAGHEAAAETGFAPPAIQSWQADDEACEASPAWHVMGPAGEAFADFQNDVTAADLELAHREGFREPEHAKRYTTLGMGTDQGKTSNALGLAILSKLSGLSPGESGATRFRPPYTPVAMGALAGHHRGRDFKPTRLTPSHGWAKEQRAVFTEAGLWLRARYFPREGEKTWPDSMTREVQTVRSAVGVCDVSTLGKIDVQGADAASFLERIYTSPVQTLPVGKMRYGVMLREDGFVMDDGTIARLGEQHFFLTATTANAVKVMQHLEFCHQAHWPELDVRMASVTEHWAQFSVAGPKSRDVLRVVVDARHGLSNEALPYLGVREVTAGGGIPARLYRVSYSGELAYEISVPSGFGDSLIRALIAAGEPFGITPYGTEALGVMRIEKGHVAGPEINGQTTALDLGLGKLLSSKKDYIGRVLSERPALVDASRPSLVGIKPKTRSAQLTGGSHFIPLGKPASARHDEGYVTSVAFSPSLGHWIGLGLLAGGIKRAGETMRACDLVRNLDVEVEVCSPVFLDPEGARLHG
jgi:methylglutamate dehydrogenase subunit C